MNVLSSDDSDDERIAQGGGSNTERYLQSLISAKGHPWTHDQKIYVCTQMAQQPMNSRKRVATCRRVDEVSPNLVQGPDVWNTVLI